MVRDMNLVRKITDRTTIYNLILIIVLLSLPLVTAQLTKNATVNISTSGTIGSIVARPLHVEGRYIKDDLGNTIYLRGVGKFRFYDDPTGWWARDGQPWYDNNWNWDESAVRQHLSALKSFWGVNHIRFHTVADWWLSDTDSYRHNLRRTIEIAGQEGLYVIFDHYSPSNYHAAGAEANQGVGIPYAPYAKMEPMRTLFPTPQDFVNYWADVANELKGYPNVVFELHNEPWCDTYIQDNFINTGQKTVTDIRNEWFDVQQDCIDAIRQTGAQQLIIVTWGVAVSPYADWQNDVGTVSMGYVDAHPLNDTLSSLVYTAHIYRSPYNFVWETEYTALKTQMKNGCLFEDVASKYPLIIGEMGVNMWESGTNLQTELEWARNVFKIANEWGIGYSAWSWTMDPNPNGEDQWGLLSNQDFPNIHLNQPSEWGQVLIDAVVEGGTIESG